MTDWQPINTAPTAWIREPSFVLGGHKVTIRNGPAIKVRGTCNGIAAENTVFWAQQEGFDHGGEPHWWDPQHEEPLPYAPTEWRPLIPADEAALDHPEQAADAPASGPPFLPSPTEKTTMKAQAFLWLLNAHGGRPFVWAQAWGRLLWLSGKPAGADPEGTISTDLGDGYTLEQDQALDWELNRASYTNLAAAIIRDLGQAAGFEFRGNPA